MKQELCIQAEVEGKAESAGQAPGLFLLLSQNKHVVYKESVEQAAE